MEIINLDGLVLRIIFFKLPNNDHKKCNKNSTVNYVVISFYNPSLFTNIFCRFCGIFMEKTTFEELIEICEQIHKE